MDSDILLQTAAIFFLSNIYLKQGIGYVCVMVDFICNGFLDLQRVGLESRPLDCEATTVTVRPWDLIHYRQVKN